MLGFDDKSRSSSIKHRSATLLIIIVILLLAFFLRSFKLDQQSLRGDEAATVLYSAMPVSELWELSRVTDPHPPLYYLSLHPWQGFMGESAWAMRFAGVIAGTLAVAALYRLAQVSLRRSPLSLLAAALLAINPLQIWLAQDIRSYPFFTLLGLLSSWSLWAALHSTQAPKKSNPTALSTPHILHLKPLSFWYLYILLTVASLYIHYYTVFLIAFQGLFVLFNTRRFWGIKWAWLGSQIAIGLLIWPGLMLAYSFIGQAAGGIDKIATSEILHLASTALLTGFTISSDWGLWLSLLLLPIWLIGLVNLLRRDFISGSFWIFYFAIPVIGVIGLSVDRPFFKERFLIQAQPAFEILLSTGFIMLWQVTRHKPGLGHASKRLILNPAASFRDYGRRLKLCVFRVIAIILTMLLLYTNTLALSNYFTDPAYAKAPPWRLYHDYVRRKFQPRDVMLTNFPEAAVSYYSPDGLPFYVVPVERDRSLEFRLEETRKIANSYERIWFLPLLRHGFDEQGDVLNWLDRHADRVDQTFFPVFHLNLYLGPAAIDKLLIEQPATFSNGIQLRGFQILDQAGKSRLTPPNEVAQKFLLSLEPEEDFTLSLYWRSGGPTARPYTVFVHLIAADSFNRAGRDNQPVWDTYPTTQWSPGERITDKYTLTIPPGTPVGDHHLRLGWYDTVTLERVQVVDETGQPANDHLMINAIIRVE